MTTTLEQPSGGGVKLADLAGDFGQDQPAEPEPQAEQQTAEPAAEAEPEPAEDPAEAPPRRRGPRPASEHTQRARERVVASDGLAGLATPTLAEAWAEQEEAIQQFRTLWWRIPRGLQAVCFVLLLGTLVLALRVLARARYVATAVVVGGGLWLLLATWGVGA